MECEWARILADFESMGVELAGVDGMATGRNSASATDNDSYALLVKLGLEAL